mmetsp:Transcript_16603/g.51926  ORF Transcript_16603/g.51926 Transcript_16603/m.51926 type:complete len:221 (+) Transcript_16603:148-810(+)
MTSPIQSNPNLAIHKPPPPQLLQLLRYRIQHRNTSCTLPPPLTHIVYVRTMHPLPRGGPMKASPIALVQSRSYGARLRPASTTQHLLSYLYTFGRLAEHGPRALDAAQEIAVDLGVGARVHLEVVVEELAELSEGVVEGRVVVPLGVGEEKVGWDASALGGHLEVKHGALGCSSLPQLPRMDGVHDRAGVLETDAVTGAVGPARPPGVDQPPGGGAEGGG